MRMSKCLCELCALIDERDQLREVNDSLQSDIFKLNEMMRSRTATIISTVGGTDYEGNPTNEINWLQRLRILVEHEEEIGRLTAYVGANMCRSDYQTVDDMRKHLDALKAEVERLNNLNSELSMQAKLDANRADRNAADYSQVHIQLAQMRVQLTEVTCELTVVMLDRDALKRTLHLACQNEIDGLRARVSELEQELADLDPRHIGGGE